MIGKIMKIEDLKISSVAEGIMMVKKMMSSKPILLVLDDVDDHEQLDSLAGSASWFCPGSLIIFTGKDKQLLRSHRVDEIHEMGNLDKYEALELFHSYAFNEKDSSIEFNEVSEKVVKYVQGHPLALKVLGRLLYGKTVGQWESELELLKVHPNDKIQSVLRLSYDGLNLHQQNILLDIACFFIGENRDFVASILDGCNFFADRNIQVLVDKSLITISSNMSLLMHDLIQAMAREIVREEFIMTGKQRRLCISSAIYNAPSEKKVPITEAVEVLVLSVEKFSQKVHIDANDFAHMNKLRILKIYQEEKVFEQILELKAHNVIISGSLYFLSNELSLFCWHGCPFKYLPSDFYPENIVVIDLSYSNIKKLWTTPKCLRRLKIMKLRYCCNLTTTPDFSEITNLEELNLEGCVNLVTVHPSIGMLKRLVVLNLKNCTRLWTSSARWWTFCLLCKQHPEKSVSLAGLHMLKDLNLSYCNLLEVPESIGGLSSLEYLELEGNNFTSLPGSLSHLSHLLSLALDGCKKLEVLPELPDSVSDLSACDCTSLCLIKESSKDPYMIKRSTYLSNCPKLFENHAIESQVPTSETQCLDLSKTSQGSTNQFSSFLRYAGIQNNICEFFRLTGGFIKYMNIRYHGNSIPEWFTNRSSGNHVMVELPSDWCFDKFRGYGTCVVFKRKKPGRRFFGYSVKNFDGASLGEWLMEPIKSNESYMIWLHYRNCTGEWEEAKNFVTFCFEEKNEEIEVKECGVRVVCDEDLEQDTNLSMLHDLPTLSQHGGAINLSGPFGYSNWSW